MSLTWTRRMSSLNRDLRALLRRTAQSVAVVTAPMPNGENAPFHGATLSSFSSIALDPYPLVAFSLRIPSRMAASLQSANPADSSHMVINILSASQEATAVRFARPDLHPHPFTKSTHALSKEGLPILHNSLGALSCKLVRASWPLHDLDALSADNQASGGAPWDGEGVASELFIACVVRVENVPHTETEDKVQQTLRTQPLLYHQQSYATAMPVPSEIKSLP